MCKITVTLADGRKKTYNSVDEWRDDVAFEASSGKPRWEVPVAKPPINTFTSPWTKPASRPKTPKVQRHGYHNPRQERSQMSMAGLSTTSTAATLGKRFARLSKKG